MSAAMPELRTPVMTRVQASWEDSGGNLQTVTACMEDKSAGGAGIRVEHPNCGWNQAEDSMAL
jgi:hypothetical protein